MPTPSLATLTEEQQLIVSEVRRFVDKEVIPVATELEHRDEYPVDLIEQLKVRGMFGATIPEEYGGLNLPFSTYAAIVEELSRGWMSLGGILNTHTMVSWMIKTYCTEDVISPVLTKTDTTAKPPYKGMSTFIVEKESPPGMTAGRDSAKLGSKGVETTEL